MRTIDSCKLTDGSMLTLGEAPLGGVSLFYVSQKHAVPSVGGPDHYLIRDTKDRLKAISIFNETKRHIGVEAATCVDCGEEYRPDDGDCPCQKIAECDSCGRSYQVSEGRDCDCDT